MSSSHALPRAGTWRLRHAENCKKPVSCGHRTPPTLTTDLCLTDISWRIKGCLAVILLSKQTISVFLPACLSLTLLFPWAEILFAFLPTPTHLLSPRFFKDPPHHHAPTCACTFYLRFFTTHTPTHRVLPFILFPTWVGTPLRWVGVDPYHTRFPTCLPHPSPTTSTLHLGIFDGKFLGSSGRSLSLFAFILDLFYFILFL